MSDFTTSAAPALVYCSPSTTRQLPYSCRIASCNEKFRTMHDFDLHYQLQHRLRCVQCGAVLSSNKFLELHIQERHDSYFKVLAEKQPMV